MDTKSAAHISKVYLKKNLSQGRTYTLKKKDAKMVKARVLQRSCRILCEYQALGRD